MICHITSNGCCCYIDPRNILIYTSVQHCQPSTLNSGFGSLCASSQLSQNINVINELNIIKIQAGGRWQLCQRAVISSTSVSGVN